MAKIITHVLAMMFGGGIALVTMALCTVSGQISRKEEKTELEKEAKTREEASMAFGVEKLEWTKDKLSPCPYCGLPRIVEKWEEDWLEDPVYYVVEHEDLKAAVKADCPTLYVSFDSVEEAIEKMNRRA